MTTLPRTGATQLANNQAVPETTVNEMCRQLDAGFCAAIIEDRDLTAAPGTCADGACYLIAASPTGTWSGKAGLLAVAVGTNASNGWLYSTVAVEGFELYVKDEDVRLRHNGTAWATPTTTAAPPGVSSQSGTTYTAVLGDANTYIRFSNASSITFTIPPNSSVAFPVGTVIEMEQAGAGALTVGGGSGVTVNSRGSDLTLAGQYAQAAAKKVATDTWIVSGDL